MDAQRGLDKLCARLDARTRRRGGERTTAAELAAAERLRSVPAIAYPAELPVVRTVSAQALVAFCGNRYSVPPGMPGAQVLVRRHLGSEQIRIVTAAGATVVVHHRAPNGAGAVVRDEGHVRALERRVLETFSAAPPCRTKFPPTGWGGSRGGGSVSRGHTRIDDKYRRAGVIDLATYAALVPAATRATTTTKSTSTSTVGGEQR